MLQAILVLLSRAYAHAHSAPFHQSAMVECIRYVDTHFREELRLEALLTRFHFSASGFYRAFRELTGKSFQQYLTGKRMELACRLLRGADLPLQAVAVQCGYGDYSVFYRAFHRYTGLTPSQYAKG